MKSKIVLAVIIGIYIASFCKYADYRQLLQGGGDSWGYYVYLPSAFIYHDLTTLDSTIAHRASYNKFSVATEDGHAKVEEAHRYKNNRVIKYTSGVAILYSPFFALAHAYCKLSGSYLPDGYSLPYNFLICLSTMLYAIAGLLLLRSYLLKYFSDSVTTVTLATIGIGTNLYFFATQNCGMSHPYLFTLFALLIYSTDKFYDNPGWKTAAVIGFCCGMITLIRPTEIIALLIPLAWNIYSLPSFKSRITFFRRNINYLLIAAALFICVNIPQLIYWKTLTGNFLFYSYAKEGFDFLHPHLKNGLTGFQNGWLVYTPVMIFAVAGFLLLPGYFKKIAVPLFIIFFLHIYIIYSWWCWQYINGFGSRPMIELYPLLSVPLALSVQYSFQKPVLKFVMLPLVLFFIFLNIFQSWQFDKGLIWTEDSNAAFYKEMFLKTRSNANALIAYDCGEVQPDTTSIKRIKILYTESFDSNTANSIQTDSNNNAYFLKKGNLPGYTCNAGDQDIQPGDYIRMSCKVYCYDLEYDHYKQAVLAGVFHHNENQIRWRILRLQNKIGNKDFSIWHPGQIHQWQYVSFFVKVPHRFKTTRDEFSMSVWNPGDKPIVIDDLQTEWWH